MEASKMIDKNFWLTLGQNIRSANSDNANRAIAEQNGFLDAINNAFAGYYGRKREQDEKDRLQNELNARRGAAADFLSGRSIDGYQFTDADKQLIMTSEDPQATMMAIYNDAQGRADTRAAEKKADETAKRSEERSAIENLMSSLNSRIQSFNVGAMHNDVDTVQFNKDVKKFEDISAYYINTYGGDAYKEFLSKNAQDEVPQLQQPSVNPVEGQPELKADPLTGKPIVEAPKEIGYTDVNSLMKDGAYTYDDIERIAQNTSPDVMEQFLARLESNANNNAMNLLKDDRVRSILQANAKSLPNETKNSLLQNFPRYASLLGDFETDFGIKEQARRDELEKKRARVTSDQNYVDQQKERKKKQEEEANEAAAKDKEQQTKNAAFKLSDMLKGTQKISRFAPPDGIDKEVWKTVCNARSNDIILHNRYVK